MSIRHLAVLCSLCAFASAQATAQGLPPGTTASSASLTAVFLFDTDLDGGGGFSWGSVRGAGSMLRQFTPQVAAGMSVSYEYQDWTFTDPAAFGGAAP